MNIFVDCGFFNGVAVKQYMEECVVDKTWDLIAFEANPKLESKKISQQYPLNNLNSVKIINKAVWTKNGKVPFHIGIRDDSSHIEGTSLNTHDREIIVPSVNFSRFIAKLPEDAYIICSMDIEGAEYPVLRQLLDDGTIERISILDIEFHHRFSNEYTVQDSAALIHEIAQRGVKVNLKVGLE